MADPFGALLAGGALFIFLVAALPGILFLVALWRIGTGAKAIAEALYHISTKSALTASMEKGAVAMEEAANSIQNRNALLNLRDREEITSNLRTTGTPAPAAGPAAPPRAPSAPGAGPNPRPSGAGPAPPAPARPPPPPGAPRS